MTGAVLAERIASAGKVHLLDLAVLKEQLGAKWARLHPHVQSFFEAAIRRVLKPGDTFCKIDELSFLVMFRELSAMEAEFACVAIAEEVCIRLFGENKQPVVLRSIVATLAVSNSPKEGAGAAEIDAYLEREGKETVVAQNGETASSSLSSGVPERMLRLRLGTTPPVRVSSRSLKFTYRPIWDTVSHTTVTYLCQPLLPSISGGARPTLEFCVAADENEQAFLDRLALLECADCARQVRNAGHRTVLAIPVHFTTVANARAWPQYSYTLRKTAGPASDTVFIVHGIDNGVPHVRLAQELPKLSRMGYRNFCVVDRGAGVGARFAKTGTRGIGVAVGERDDETGAASKIQAIAKEARTAGVASFVLGARSTSLTLMAISQGVRYIEGPAVRSTIDVPRHGFAQDVEDLYAAKLSSG